MDAYLKNSDLDIIPSEAGLFFKAQKRKPRQAEELTRILLKLSTLERTSIK